MKTFAPELSALMTIFRSTGPVISVRRSRRSAGAGATFHRPSRTDRVDGRKSGSTPASSCTWRAARACSSAWRRGSNSRKSPAMNAHAPGVRISAYSGGTGARNSRPEEVVSVMVGKLSRHR